MSRSPFSHLRLLTNDWRRPLTAAVDWWLGELRPLIPPRLRRARSGEWIVDVDPQGVTVLQGGHRQPLPHNRAPLRRGPVLLAVAATAALEKCWELPRAAEENLREVIAFEMSRHTPFAADEVLFQYQVLERGDAGIRVRVTLVPKARVDDALARLAADGIKPHALSVTLGDTERRIPLAVPPAANRRRTAALATASALLAGVAVLLPVMHHHERIATLEAQVAAARLQAAEARQLETTWRSSLDSHRELLARRAGQPQVVAILRQLTEALPDDTWLLRLELAREELRLEGESSGGASRLIGLLENVRVLRDAHFTAPVTVDRESGRERFTVVAKLAGGDA